MTQQVPPLRGDEQSSTTGGVGNPTASPATPSRDSHWWHSNVAVIAAIITALGAIIAAVILARSNGNSEAESKYSLPPSSPITSSQTSQNCNPGQFCLYRTDNMTNREVNSKYTWCPSEEGGSALDIARSRLLDSIGSYVNNTSHWLYVYDSKGKLLGTVAPHTSEPHASFRGAERYITTCPVTSDRLIENTGE